LLALRTQRYEDEAVGIWTALEAAGIAVVQFDSARSVEVLADEVAGLLIPNCRQDRA
jgi:hypothetical protein